MYTNNHEYITPHLALQRLYSGNQTYLNAHQNPANISPEVRWYTAQNGQYPFAVVLTCSDSRVPPEHIFSVGIGELFVVRTAGNVVGDYELGSIEFAVKNLGVPLILIMGHSNCGAVTAALHGYTEEDHIKDVVREIQIGLHGATNENTAIYNNILHSKRRVMESAIVQKLVHTGQVAIVCSEYNIATGKVDFFRC